MSHIEQKHSSSSDSESDDEDDKLIKQLAREVEQQLVLDQPVTKSISYAVIKTTDQTRTRIDGLFTTRAAANAHMIRLAVNLGMTDYPEHARINDKAATLTQGEFLKSVTASMPYDYKIVILDHLDITQPVYIIMSRINDLISNDIIKSLTNSLETWQGVIDKEKCYGTLRKWLDDGRWLKYCTLQINSPLPKLHYN
jgi:hypothetical protein